MVEVEIIVAIIGASVTLVSPFVALCISKCCNKKPPPPPPPPPPQPLSDTPPSIPDKKPLSICEIYSTKLLPPLYIADQRYCYLSKKICSNCGLTFCENHLSNNTTTGIGGHICSRSICP